MNNFVCNVVVVAVVDNFDVNVVTSIAADINVVVAIAVVVYNDILLLLLFMSILLLLLLCILMLMLLLLFLQGVIMPSTRSEFLRMVVLHF